MNKELVNAIVDYIDKKIEYKLACMEVGADDHYSSHPTERKLMEEALKNVYSISGQVNEYRR